MSILDSIYTDLFVKRCFDISCKFKWYYLDTMPTECERDCDIHAPGQLGCICLFIDNVCINLLIRNKTQLAKRHQSSEQESPINERSVVYYFRGYESLPGKTEYCVIIICYVLCFSFLVDVCLCLSNM